MTQMQARVQLAQQSRMSKQYQHRRRMVGEGKLKDE